MVVTSIYRHELKFRIDQATKHLLVARLAAVMTPDKHGPVYHISNTYFDDLALSSYYEKTAGVLERDKYRTRHYNNDTSHVRLECKHKHGDLMRKTSAPLDKEELFALRQGDFSPLREGNPLRQRLFALAAARRFTPSVTVDYDRTVFVYSPGNVRVTFDEHLCAGGVTDDVKTAVLPDGIVILEVKYDLFLPSAVGDLFATVPLHQTAVSKYTLCKEMCWNLFR